MFSLAATAGAQAQQHTRDSRFSRLGTETPRLSVKDSSRNRTRVFKDFRTGIGLGIKLFIILEPEPVSESDFEGCGTGIGIWIVFYIMVESEPESKYWGYWVFNLQKELQHDNIPQKSNASTIFLHFPSFESRAMYMNESKAAENSQNCTHICFAKAYSGTFRFKGSHCYNVILCVV